MGVVIAIIAIPAFVAKVRGMEAPLHSGPFFDSNGNGAYDTGDIPGQSKRGDLVIGGASSMGAGANLSNHGMLQITKTPCIAGSPCSADSSAPELRSLLGGYAHTAVIGDPSLSTPFAGSALDVRGSIKADPAASYLNYAAGTLYTDGTTTSATDKRICANALGDLITCPPGI